jgi:hypothetical protein
LLPEISGLVVLAIAMMLIQIMVFIATMLIQIMMFIAMILVGLVGAPCYRCEALARQRGNGATPISVVEEHDEIDPVAVARMTMTAEKFIFSEADDEAIMTTTT